jgi:hypothetical protein
MAFVAAMEAQLKTRGFQPSAVDNDAVWIRERARASSLGVRAVTLVGSSRMQTGIDLDVLRDKTGLEPVQLAIDGSSFIPVLAGLAKDARITGTVIVAFQDGALIATEGASDIADRYESLYEEQSGAFKQFDYFFVENLLSGAVRHYLRSYADGIRPLRSLMARVIPPRPHKQNVIILPDRSRLVDFSTAEDIVAVRYVRALRELGNTDLAFQKGTDYSVIDARIREEIAALPKRPQDLYERRAASIAADAATIESRGGHVVFVVMPTSGLITEMEDKQFPRNEFWDRFAAMTRSRTLHFKDIPSLRSLPVPDGSHIDYHDRAALTSALLDALKKDDTRKSMPRS